MIRYKSNKRPGIIPKGLYLSILWSVLTTAVFGSVTGTISLTDKNGVPQPNFPSGANVYIQVDDADRNLDTSKAETITVLLSTETEPDGEIIALYYLGISVWPVANIISDEPSEVSRQDSVRKPVY